MTVMGARRLALAAFFGFACACSPSATAPTPSSAPSSTAPSQAAAASPSPSASPAPSATSSPAPTASAAPTVAPTPAPTAVPTIPQVKLARAMGGLAFNSMTGAFQGPDGRWYVLEQPGRILTFREGDASATAFLDIRDHVDFGGA